MRISRQLAVCLFMLVISRGVFAACAVERAPVKSGTDADAGQVSRLPLPTTIEALHALPAPRPLPHDRRLAPAETTTYLVTATLIAYRMTPEADIQLVLSDSSRRTIVATIPSPACAAGSPFLADIESARAAFERRYVATAEFTETRRAVEVQGVGFFDFLQGQRGLAPNGLSLHPVTALDFTPSYQPKPPAQVGRRRSVSIGGSRGCLPPTLNITPSRGSTCAAGQVTLAWQASDASASVTIDGIGTLLPASGSRTLPLNASTIYSGRATTSCGTGNEAATVVTVTPPATGLLTGPSSVTVGNNATLSVSIAGAESWTLTSSLGNSISPASGTSSQSVSYHANRSGTDTVTLNTIGGTCANVMRTLTIVVGQAPSTGGLRCCDGTRSPTCFNCSDKRGCCSGHGGVCGCP